MMPAVEIAVLFLVVALIMGLLGLVALVVHRRTARPAGDGEGSVAGAAPGTDAGASPEAAPARETPPAPEATGDPVSGSPASPVAGSPAAHPAEPPVPSSDKRSAAAQPPAPTSGKSSASRRRKAPASGLPKPLPEQARQRYLTAWTGVQDRFEDSPVLALSQADALLGALLAERGLPSDGKRTQADLPAGPGGRVLEEFRLGHLIEQTNSTVRSDLAQVSVGMEHFRRVFEELVHPSDVADPASAADRDTPG